MSDEKPKHEKFEILTKGCIFEVKPFQQYSFGPGPDREWDWSVRFLHYEGKLRLGTKTYEAVRKEVEAVIELYARNPDYGEMPLSDFLAKALPD